MIKVGRAVSSKKEIYKTQNGYWAVASNGEHRYLFSPEEVTAEEVLIAIAHMVGEQNGTIPNTGTDATSSDEDAV